MHVATCCNLTALRDNEAQVGVQRKIVWTKSTEDDASLNHILLHPISCAVYKAIMLRSEAEFESTQNCQPEE